MMTMKNIKAQVRIGRYMNSDQEFFLEIQDEASGARFLKLEFGPEAFADLLSNRISYMEGEVCALDVVGKEYVSQHVEVRMPDSISPYDKKEAAEYLKTYKPVFEKSNEGWQLDTYIGSQDSIVRQEDGVFAQLKMFKYVDKENA